MGNATGGGILYNKKVFAQLGLQIPKTWADFMANNAKIKAAGIDPVIQTYGDTWTSQLFVLADFHNVIFPLLRSVIVTIVVVQSIFVFNDFQNPCTSCPVTLTPPCS